MPSVDLKATVGEVRFGNDLRIAKSRYEKELKMFCHSCAHPNPSDYRFCLNCGTVRGGFEELMTPREVAALLQVSRAWVRSHCVDREPFLPYIELGTDASSLRRFIRSEVLDFIDERRTQTVSTADIDLDGEDRPDAQK